MVTKFIGSNPDINIHFSIIDLFTDIIPELKEIRVIYAIKSPKVMLYLKGVNKESNSRAC